MKNGTTLKFSKADLIFFYQRFEFPNDLIDKSHSKVADLIFSNESQDPENDSTKKKLKFANCFIVEEEIEPKKGMMKKGKAPPSHRPSYQDTWKRAEPDDPGFFDDFRGKSDVKQVVAFKRNLELIEIKEMSISIQKSVLIDYVELQDKEFFETKKNKNIKSSNLNTGNTREITATADELFNDDSLFGNVNQNTSQIQSNNDSYISDLSRRDSIDSTRSDISQNQQAQSHQFSNSIYQTTNKDTNHKDVSDHISSDPDPKKINFKNAYRINEYLKYSKDEPLWYLFHPVAKSSFGPCSTANLEEMYNGQMVNGQSEIRFIDIYSLKNKKPFTFFKLKELDNLKFLENIDVSPLLTNAITLNCRMIIDKNHKK